MMNSILYSRNIFSRAKKPNRPFISPAVQNMGAFEAAAEFPTMSFSVRIAGIVVMRTDGTQK